MRTLLAIVGGAAAVAVGYSFQRAGEGGLIDLRPAPPSPPLPGEAPSPGAPLRLTSPFPLAPGSRYVASVKVGFPLSIAASSSDVEREARNAGLKDATVTKTRPAIVPIATGDYYVTGTYSGPPMSLQRSQGGGRVTVEDVWRIG